MSRDEDLARAIRQGDVESIVRLMFDSGAPSVRNSGSVTLERRRVRSMIGHPNKEQMSPRLLGAEEEEIAMRAE